MLEKVGLSKKLSKGEFKSTIGKMQSDITILQRKCKELGIPVMIVFEGWSASGKGVLINELIEPMDPRGFEVFTIHKATEDEKMRPFLWRFFTKIPSYGHIAIYDRSWYRKIIDDKIEGKIKAEKLKNYYYDIASFEQQLIEDGMLIIKFFLHISQEEQLRRLDKLSSNKETAWRVKKVDYKQNKQYPTMIKAFNKMMEHTSTAISNWNIIEATDKNFAISKIMSIISSNINEAIEKKRWQLEDKEIQKDNDIVEEEKDKKISAYKTSVLDGIDLTKSLTKEKYKKELEKYQQKLSMLHNILYQKRIPLILAFEGWDAGGKGGAIKRLTQSLDPRGYKVIPVAAPNDIEKQHHYLWRFWNKIQKDGHITIFDRTWYGRVMVEKIEGFCLEEEWKRAYKEINDMEAHIANHGAVILKFWMHIDKDEQANRFNARLENPDKQWKITEEDWRNREKWDDYKEAVDEMIIKTSTTYAPWVIVEGNNKYYARIKILKTIVETLETII